MKPIENLRNHPTLKHDSLTSVFVIEQRLYCYTKDGVTEILPSKILYTNIGEPFAELARFVFVTGNDERAIDIHPSDVSDLISMCEAIGVELLISGKVKKLLSI